MIDRPAPALEAPEIAGYRDLWAAAPDALVARYGLAHADVAGAHCTAARALPGMRLLNHALGLHDGPDVSDVLDAVERFFTDHSGSALVAVPEGAAAEAPLAARGYERDYAWVKFVRPAVPASAVATGFSIRPVAASDAERMGELIAAGFELPGDMAVWFAGLVDRLGWHCFGAYDGARLVATGTLYVDGDAGWLTWAATNRGHRGRGAQKALLGARIAHSHELGLEMLVTETGEPEPGRPDASYRNIVAAGFQPVFRRPFWRRGLDRAGESGEAAPVKPIEEEPWRRSSTANAGPTSGQRPTTSWSPRSVSTSASTIPSSRGR